MVKVGEGTPHPLRAEGTAMVEGVMGQATQLVHMEPLYRPIAMELPTHMQVCHGSPLLEVMCHLNDAGLPHLMPLAWDNHGSSMCCILAGSACWLRPGCYGQTRTNHACFMKLSLYCRRRTQGQCTKHVWCAVIKWGLCRRASLQQHYNAQLRWSRWVLTWCLEAVMPKCRLQQVCFAKSAYVSSDNQHTRLYRSFFAHMVLVDAP